MSSFIHELANYIDQHKHTIDEALARFQLRRENFITPSEMRTVIAEMRLRISTSDVDEVTMYFLDRRTDRIQTSAMKRFLRPKIAYELHQLLDRKKQGDDLNAHLIRAMVMYMRKHHLTVYDLYKEIDIGHDKVVSRLELGKFIRKIGVELDGSKLDDLLNSFDQNKDGRVDFNEFFKVVKPYLVERTETTATVDEILTNIATYMNKNQITLASLFTSLDQNKDGFLNRTELKDFIHKHEGPTDEEKINEILGFFDHNGDNRISIKEFINVLKPYMEKAESLPSPSMKSSQRSHRHILGPLRKKLSSLIKENSTNLEAGFNMYSESSSPSFITRDNFRRVLKDLNMPTDCQ